MSEEEFRAKVKRLGEMPPREEWDELGVSQEARREWLEADPNVLWEIFRTHHAPVASEGGVEW